ncbi:MAG: methionyl-tRNA formyltransferase, partial [Bacteroidaceae bacterium]|nr:methionyl-tRNA formyltransferase [Bacteroidaceae bacterium]
SDGYINIQTLQLSGKKKMAVSDFLRGFKCENGMRMC